MWLSLWPVVCPTQWNTNTAAATRLQTLPRVMTCNWQRRHCAWRPCLESTSTKGPCTTPVRAAAASSPSTPTCARQRSTPSPRHAGCSTQPFYRPLATTTVAAPVRYAKSASRKSPATNPTTPRSAPPSSTRLPGNVSAYFANRCNRSSIPGRLIRWCAGMTKFLTGFFS